MCSLVRKPNESQKANDVHIRLSVVGTKSTQVVLVCRESCLRSSVTKAQNSKKQKQKEKRNKIKLRRATHPSDTCGNVTKDLSNTLPEKQRYDAPPTAQNKVTVMSTTERLQKKVAKIWRLKRTRPVGVHTRDAREQPSHAEQQASGPTEIETSWQFTEKCGTTRTSESPRPRREALC